LRRTTVTGVVVTLFCFAIDPMFGWAAAVICGNWVLLGIGSVIHAATDKPAEHHVYVRGAVAHVVVDPPAVGPSTRQPNPRRTIEPQPPRPKQVPHKVVIECPRCSMHVFPDAAACVCGWQVSEASSGAVMRRIPQPRPENAVRTCPACPDCRAPTVWVAEHERFFCSRCDAYLSAS